jgi:hypothetical protein
MANLTKKELTEKLETLEVLHRDYLDYLRFLTSSGKHEIDIWEVKKALTEISLV